MTDYPVDVEVRSPARYERIQLLIRVVLLIALGWLGLTERWLAFFLYLALPLIAAVTISSLQPERFTTDIAPRAWRVLSWLFAFDAYMLMLTDRVPLDRDDSVAITLRRTGTPDTKSAVLRLVTSIPSAFVLMLLWFVSGILWLVSFVTVLFDRTIPDAILRFQLGVLRWNARLAAYHLSLVDEYPPFSLRAHPTPPHAQELARRRKASVVARAGAWRRTASDGARCRGAIAVRGSCGGPTVMRSRYEIGAPPASVTATRASSRPGTIGPTTFGLEVEPRRRRCATCSAFAACTDASAIGELLRDRQAVEVVHLGLAEARACRRSARIFDMSPTIEITILLRRDRRPSRRP